MASSIQPQGSSPVISPNVQRDTAEAAGKGLQMTGLSPAAMDEILGEMAAAAATMSDTRPSGGSNGAAGLPTLPEATRAFSSDEMVDLLRSLREKSQDGQLKAAQHGLESKRVQSEKNTEKQLDKIKEWIEKCEDAKSKSVLGKIFGWIGKIFALIAAVVAVAVLAAATVATGGAAAPLLAMAAIGLVGATISMADQISQECGGPKISIGNLMTQMVGKLLMACGVPEEKAMSIGKMVGGICGLACPVMLLVEPSLLSDFGVGIAELAGADEKTKNAIGLSLGIAATVMGAAVMIVAGAGAGAVSSTVSGAVKVTTQLVQAAGMIVAGSMQVGQGITNIQVAKFREDADKAIADKKDLAATMLKLQQQMQEDREEIKKVLQQIEDGIQAVTQMINGSADSMAQVTANLGRRQTV